MMAILFATFMPNSDDPDLRWFVAVKLGFLLMKTRNCVFRRDVSSLILLEK